jgi:hypothetical protein
MCCIILVIIPPPWNTTRHTSTTLSLMGTSQWLAPTMISMRPHPLDECLMRGRERSLASPPARHILCLIGEGAALQSVVHLSPSTLAQLTPSIGNSTTISILSFTALAVDCARTIPCTSVMACWSMMPHLGTCGKRCVLTSWVAVMSQVGAHNARAGSLKCQLLWCHEENEDLRDQVR